MNIVSIPYRTPSSPKVVDIVCAQSRLIKLRHDGGTNMAHDSRGLVSRLHPLLYACAQHQTYIESPTFCWSHLHFSSFSSSPALFWISISSIYWRLGCPMEAKPVRVTKHFEFDHPDRSAVCPRLSKPY